ncbi:MAG: MCE family protein [Lentisphaerae bacterium]|nr:MCE family protein [Lentisphaerota bacterium]
MNKDWMARELTMEVVVGVFIVMVFLGMGYFTIILSRETWFGTKERVEVVFDNVMGLREGDSVVARGMPVGKVEHLALGNSGVRVTAQLDQPLNIREDYRITIEATSILGGRHMEIDEGSPDAALAQGDGAYRGSTPYDLMKDAAEVMNALRKGLVENGAIEHLQQAASDLQAVIARINAGKGTLGKLMSEDDSLYENLSAGVASMRKIAERLESGQGTLGKLMSEDDTVYEDMSAAVASLRTVAERLERGEGMLGKLTQEDGLYAEIEATVKEVRASMDDMREMSPVVTFTSIFFGAF